MKIRLDIDASPQELRTFFGLPDVEALQNQMIDHIRKQMEAGMAGFDPATLLKPFLPEHLRSLEALQKSFWASFMDPAKKTGDT